MPDTTTTETLPRLPDILTVEITQRLIDAGTDEETGWTPFTRALVIAAAKAGIPGCGISVYKTDAVFRTGSGNYWYALGNDGIALADAIDDGEPVNPVTLYLQRDKPGERKTVRPEGKT